MKDTRIIPDFNEKIMQASSQTLILEDLETLQVNLGNKCNQSCAHCHVKAGPDGMRIMTRSVMGKIIHFLREKDVFERIEKDEQLQKAFDTLKINNGIISTGKESVYRIG